MTIKLTSAQLAKYIDHTLLKQEASVPQIAKLCEEAIKYNFAAICVNATNIAQCAKLLKGTDVKLSSTVGFPLGATLPSVKAYETEQAIAAGASEIDMVMNVGAMKSGNLALVKEDIAAVVKAAHAHKVIVKVIIETCLLTDDEKVKACQICKEVGADFVKTSTGFNSAGATVADVALMRKTVGPDMGVKAAGGVRTREDVLAMIEAGATRIGTSGGVKIMEGAEIKSGY
ncbi:deoxyribose-phosphate aldolase [Leptolinea tardivitalis]|uniref:Deoxyribose-phosphate aldolase n=1 Tax=Leptolinea tardivitalis TaxID=229920 RepID=A0A0N8GL71_9CHLR|nr:deoxyribose-phosphate aldolase [Leptolinea tardivitalis]KPL71682.1 deoxyribose-phosphate aldolase [Leptolinea tardivitalis]GAP20027.1 deoxyribose-phosphate aldolase [Leptolinea tardivitalis]